MAITQVRARLGTEWVDLTYNPATGRYEGYVTPGGTSYHQPGGYFVLEAIAANDTGQSYSIGGDALESLRLVVQETVVPALTLISPTSGYINTKTPTFVFEATDDGGGSGVDPGTFTPAPTSVTAIPNGFRFTWTPPEAWSEGPHTITASVRDYDGNQASASAAYFVDTVPPTLEVKGGTVHVVDTDRVTFHVNASDIGSGMGQIIVNPPAEVDGDTYTAPLKVGENNIVVTAYDKAGNASTDTLYMIRLVTDRTAEDVEQVRKLLERGIDSWTAAELEWFNDAIVRGAYNSTDLNRVSAAVRFLSEELNKRGHQTHTDPYTDWTEQDVPTESSMKAYLDGVKSVVTAQPLIYLIRQPIPSTMRKLDTTGANQIEKALTMVEEPFSRYRSWACGEITAGEG